MARFNYRELSSKKQREFLDRLAEIVATIRKKDEARYFLERLLTESEIVMLIRRLQVAEMLVSGLTYDQIQRKLNAGMSTIRSIDGWLTDAAYEYQQIRAYQREAIKKVREGRRSAKRQHSSSTMPRELRHTIRFDSRFILFRLLLDDF